MEVCETGVYLHIEVTLDLIVTVVQPSDLDFIGRIIGLDFTLCFSSEKNFPYFFGEKIGACKANNEKMLCL